MVMRAGGSLFLSASPGMKKILNKANIEGILSVNCVETIRRFVNITGSAIASAAGRRGPTIEDFRSAYETPSFLTQPLFSYSTNLLSGVEGRS